MDSGQNANGGNARGGFLQFGSGAGVSDDVGATSGISGNVGNRGFSDNLTLQGGGLVIIHRVLHRR